MHLALTVGNFQLTPSKKSAGFKSRASCIPSAQASWRSPSGYPGGRTRSLCSDSTESFVRDSVFRRLPIWAYCSVYSLWAGGGVRSVPPQVMTVEIVPPDEAPQIETREVEGTPLD